MKTTLELPDDLMRAVKIRAVQSNQKLKDFVAAALRTALESSGGAAPQGPLEALRARLVFHPDGTVTNPDGVDDLGFFDEVEDIRRHSRLEAPRDPFGAS